MAVSLCLLGIALFFISPEVSDRIRIGVREAARPGQLLALHAARQAKALLQRYSPPSDVAQQMAELQQELDGWKQRARQLQAENGLLREELQEVRQQAASPYVASESKPLMIPELLEATVLGDETAVLWRSGKFIDRGTAHGLQESDLVLENPQPIIDQGADADLAADQMVYAGRVVVGKVGLVGRWSSTVQLVTDRNYRGGAQLGRFTQRGASLGAKGILEGTGGELCQLKYVSSEEAVRVGDDVYTAGHDGLFPNPMYYGKVVQAELKAGAPNWEIWVQPAVLDQKLKRVAVFRKVLNPERLMGN